MKSRIVSDRSGSAASVGFGELVVIPALEHNGDVVGQWFFGVASGMLEGGACWVLEREIAENRTFALDCATEVICVH